VLLCGLLAGVVEAGALLCGSLAGVVEAGALLCGLLAGVVEAGALLCGWLAGVVEAGALLCGSLAGAVEAGTLLCGSLAGAVEVGALLGGSLVSPISPEEFGTLSGSEKFSEETDDEIYDSPGSYGSWFAVQPVIRQHARIKANDFFIIAPFSLPRRQAADGCTAELSRIPRL